MTGRDALPGFFRISGYPSFQAKHRAISSCIKWNEKQTARCVREHSRVNNNARRTELKRNADRHTANAQKLRALMAEA